MTRKIIFTFISVLLGLVFIFSGITKLFPIELFELTFVDLGVANWYTAPVVARLMIATEFFLGILLVLNFSLRKFTIKATIVMLVVFTIYLIIQLVIEGNKGNCKCFGNVIVMTPLESIIKNLLMLAIAVVIFIWHKGFTFPFKKIIMLGVILFSISLPFILNPPDFIMAYQSQPETIGYKLNLDTLYNSSDLKKPEIELRNGKHIISFMSLTCSHCHIAAYKFYLIKKESPDIPIFFILNGKDKDITPFFEDTKATNIPFMILRGKRFADLAGYKLPCILFINNTIIEKKTNYIDLNYDEIKKWLKE
ncbi:MAG: DoxX family protein [Bacteroidota bacterium]